MIKYIPIALLFFVACAAEEKEELKHLKLYMVDEEVFQTYDWARFTIPELGDFDDHEFSIEGGGEIRLEDTTFWLATPDTAVMQLRITRKSDGVLVSQSELQAETNPHFNPEWDTLKFGEYPVPLLDGEGVVYRMYQHFNDPKTFAVPDFQQVSIHGDTLTQESLLGKVTLLNFWYWPCMPCQMEMPMLRSIADSYKKNENVQLLSFFLHDIEIGESGNLTFYGPDRKNVVDSLDLDFIHVPNCERLTKSFPLRGYPTNWIIDSEGVVQKAVRGVPSEGSFEADIRDEIERLLAEG